jgi:hypothetical protein
MTVPKITQKHWTQAMDALISPIMQSVDVCNKAIEIALSEQANEQYITAKQARELGAGRVEFYAPNLQKWLVCGEVFNYLDCFEEKYKQTTIKYRAIKPQAQPVSWNTKYTDSTPKLSVGNSAFEDWFQAQPFATQTGIKQMCRDSYAAGMGDPLVTYVTTQAQPEPVKILPWTGSREDVIALLKEKGLL